MTRTRHLPAVVASSTLQDPLDWPDATVIRGDAGDVVARLKEESDVPLRSHGSLSMNRALMAAGLVGRWGADQQSASNARIDAVPGH